MRKEDINGLTPEEIQIKYALPDLPNHWTTVNLNAGDELRISITNQNFDLDGGAIQFDLLGQRIGLFGNENKIGNVLEIP
ncbi:MAG: hypothetical protein JEZ00_17250 [Anaerolineaceae bacterium]|nr:hypothetical protein [Anaerolineaceae bacterium]